MITVKKYFLSESEREKYEEPLLKGNDQNREKIYQLDDEQLLTLYKQYMKEKAIEAS